MATRRIRACDVAHDLTAAGHSDATRGPAWTPGHRAVQASPRTVRCWHDGPDEQAQLDLYAVALRTRGYTVTPERGKAKRPALRVTHP
ncbi:hypothetical protein VSR01_16470 [Actinacidiphila sp. DG2A-62]|uniref:hypothetical protein n=1 Tax=Actinacidiphila sp. DG2A-62 TaxID=3108821 RepID=UPI002DBE55E2|nr:hypothetical protein [Actinacidiphila sp. DG2A-62]MEC3995041.1 hypothetical protein [Actinacidiphila sp. DG2A-62]